MTEKEYVLTTPIETEQIPDVTPPPPRPRTRWGAIVWGVIVLATATTTLVIRSDPARSQDFAAWVGGLTPISIGLLAILALGVIVLVVSLLSVAKRAQLRARTRELAAAGGQPVG